MNTGQTILTIGAVILLGMNVISTNRTFTQHGAVLQQTEIGIFAVSLATSLLEEAEGKVFDKRSLTDSCLTNLSQLTPKDSLGPDVTDSTRADYDDFDDYNWMTGGPTRDSIIVRRDTIVIKDVDTFYRWAKVCYVDTSSPDTYRGYSTWNKKLTVYIKARNSSDTLKMSYIFSYWSFE